MLSSCMDGNKAKFEISNATPFLIDSLCVESTNPVTRQAGYKTRQLLSLHPQQNKVYLLDLGKETNDGSYLLSFITNGERKSQAFGYYTNGYVVEKVTKIQIASDSIFIQPVYKD